MGESALATFVVFLFDCFVQLMRLTLDLICTTLFLCALSMPWRWPFIPKAVSKGMTSRGRFEGMCAAQFFLGLGDVICFAVLLVPLCTGLQTVQLCYRLGESDNWHEGGWYFAALESLFMLVVDLVFLVFWSSTALVLLILVVTIIRLPKLCGKLSRSEVKQGWTFSYNGMLYCGDDDDDKYIASLIPKNVELFASTWGQ